MAKAKSTHVQVCESRDGGKKRHKMLSCSRVSIKKTELLKQLQVNNSLKACHPNSLAVLLIKHQDKHHCAANLKTVGAFHVAHFPLLHTSQVGAQVTGSQVHSFHSA